jgi:hypothetical protein
MIEVHENCTNLGNQDLCGQEWKVLKTFWGLEGMIECLPSICEALGLILPGNQTNKQKTNNNF